VNKIGRITTGGVITEFGGLTAAVSGISGPVDIAAGQDGRLWFTEFGQNKIGAITTAGVVTEYSTGLTANAGPDRIVSGPDGRMWFTEYKAGKIGAITTGGTITEYPLTPGDSQPGAVTVGPDGALWFAGSGGLSRITTQGVATLEDGGPSGISRPVELASTFGSLWFTQDYYNEIGRYDIQNRSLVTFGPALYSYGVAGITGGPDGAIWFTDSASWFVGRITTNGLITNEIQLPNVNSEPQDIVSGPDGALWFVERGGRIGRVTTDVPPPPTVEIKLSVVSPPSDSNRFSLAIDGATKKLNAKDGDTTGKQPVSVQNHWISEAGPLAGYGLSITCTDQGGLGSTVASSTDYEVLVPVQSGSDIVCTVVNTRHDPPSDLSVSQSSGIVKASWALPPPPPDMLTGFLEFSPTPDTDSDGFFTGQGTITYEFDSTDTEFDSTPETFPPGTYYVHVSAFDPDTCDFNGCQDKFSSPPVKVVVPAPARGSPAPPAPPAASPDRVTAFSSLLVRSRQSFGKLYVEAAMGEPGTIAARGRVTIAGLAHPYALRAAFAPAVPGTRVRLHLRLARKALADVRKALRRHRKVTAKITITATDLAGNVKQEQKIVRLRQ
jgi:virginiamycin B lyase